MVKINNFNNNQNAVDIDKIFQRKLEKIKNSKETEYEKEKNNEKSYIKLNNNGSFYWILNKILKH